MKKELDPLAEQHGWQRIPTKDPYMDSFVKNYGGSPARMNVWHSERSHRGFTVGTCITHPKKGKTQMFRKFCSLQEVETLMKNPRHHSGKGYR